MRLSCGFSPLQPFPPPLITRLVDGFSKTGISFVPYEQSYEHGFEDMRRRVPDITKVGEYIGWSPQRTLEETLKEITHWYISEGVVAA